MHEPDRRKPFVYLSHVSTARRKCLKEGFPWTCLRELVGFPIFFPWTRTISVQGLKELALEGIDEGGLLCVGT